MTLFWDVYSFFKDPPSVGNLTRNLDRIEGNSLSINCHANPGNPKNTTYYWTKVDNRGFIQNGSTLQLSNIQRNSSGTYICTAENSFYNGDKGKHNQSMFVNVLCKWKKIFFRFNSFYDSYLKGQYRIIGIFYVLIKFTYFDEFYTPAKFERDLFTSEKIIQMNVYVFDIAWTLFISYSYKHWNLLSYFSPTD